MWFYLCTAFGDSDTFAKSLFQINSQELCQGNTGISSGWVVITITKLQTHKQCGHTTKFIASILNVKTNLAAFMYVNEDNIIILDMTWEETPQETLTALKASVSSWGHLLIATGDTLDPTKCFFHRILFKWNQGKWDYNIPNNAKTDVPMPTGQTVLIKHKLVTTTQKTIGIYSNPVGNNDQAIKALRKKRQNLVDKAVKAKLRHRSM